MQDMMRCIPLQQLITFFQYPQDLMSTVADECWSLTSCNKKLSREERTERLRNISSLLNETIKRGEEKFALAKSTYDTVSVSRSDEGHSTFCLRRILVLKI